MGETNQANNYVSSFLFIVCFLIGIVCRDDVEDYDPTNPPNVAQAHDD